MTLDLDLWFVLRFPKPLLCSPFDMIDMIHLMWFVDMIYLIWALLWYLWFDSDLLSTWLWLCDCEILLYYALGAFCSVMLWEHFVMDSFALFILICSVLMPEFLVYSWRYHGHVIDGTNGMTLSGAVWLVPGVPVCLWYDMRSLGHFGYMICLWGAYGCILGMFDMIWYDLILWLDVRALYPFHVWYLEVFPVRTPMNWRICDYVIWDLFEYLVRSARGFPMFLMSIRVSR